MANNAQAWLPSEVEPSRMDKLFRGFGLLTLPAESNRRTAVSGAAPNLPPKPEDLTPLAGYSSTSITRPAPPMPSSTILSGCGPHGAGVCFFRPKLTDQYPFVNPAAQPQSQDSRASRASPEPGMMDWHRNQLFPSGLVGPSRGTGVFHPQNPRFGCINKNKIIRNKREKKISKQDQVKVSPAQRNSSKVARGLEKKKEFLAEKKNSKQYQVKATPAQRNSSKVVRGLERKKEECRHQYLLPEIGLPNEWTY